VDVSKRLAPEVRPRGRRSVEERVYDRLRINVRTLAEEKPYATLPISRRDVEAIHAEADITRFALSKPHGVVSRFVWHIRRLLHRLLFPVFRRQALYAEANTRVILNLAERVDLMSDALSRLENRLGSDVVPGLQVTAEFDMFELEERFRGTEAEIARRQSRYVDHFRRGPVLDLGCGRGEFLELMRQRGIESRGVDLDSQMVERCREKGLSVVEAEAIRYLEQLEDESIGGVFCAQVIEHMLPQQVMDLVRLCARKVRPGGTVVLETPNPESLQSLSSFSLDFTHVRLYHPLAIEWLLRKVGMEVSLDFSVPVEDFDPDALYSPGANPTKELRRLLERVGQAVLGPQTYAAIGIRTPRF
jgi:SAM-dependent methyltransferase